MFLILLVFFLRLFCFFCLSKQEVLDNLTINNWHAVIAGVFLSQNKLLLVDKADEHVYLSWPKNKSAPNIGDKVYCETISLLLIKQYNNPGASNYLRQNFYRAKGANCKVVGRGASWLGQIRAKLLKTLSSLDFIANFTIIKSLVLGHLVKMTQNQYTVLQKTGVLHLMAISGLHIGCLLRVFQFSFYRLFAVVAVSRLYAKLYFDLLAWILVVFYALLSGFSVASQRACLMSFVVLLAQGLHIKIAGWQVWVLAFLLIVFISPSALVSPGFWLSFVGIFILLAQNDFGFLDAFRAYLLMFFAMLIICLGFFHTVSLAGLVANFIAIPVFSLWVVPFSLFGVIATCFSQELAWFLWQLAAAGLNLLWPGLAWLSDYGYLALAYAPFYSYVLAFFGVILILLLPFWRFSYLAVFWCLPFLFLKQFSGVLSHEFLLTVLDVGQGLAVVIKTKNHTMLYDTGPRYKNWDAGKSIVLPYLHWLGVDKTDKMVVSHGDLDHSGGAFYVDRHMLIDETISSEPERLSVLAYDCFAGQKWVWDGVTFEILSPPLASSWAGNRRSCVLLVANAKKKVLLTGDVDVLVEKWLLNHYNIKVDGLLVSHHGSLTASSEVFLDKIKPKWAIISSGLHNKFNLPNNKVVKRYKKRNIKLLDTQKLGAITFLSDGGF